MAFALNGQDAVGARLRDAVEEFRQLLPVVQALGDPTLQARHWAAIFGVIGAGAPPPNNTGTGAL